MAQTGYTPISSYYSATTGNTPTAGNLVAGELAINTADGKLFYKDSSGVVQTLATKDATSGSFTNLFYTGTLTGGTGVVNLGSGQFYKDASGNVGIGQSTPVSKVDILGSYGAANRSLKIKPSANGADIPNLRTVIIENASNDGSLVSGFSTATDAWVISSTYGSTGAYKPLVFATSDTERMRIDSSGNVGIGTTTTTSGKLNVKASTGGTALYATDSVNADFFIDFPSSQISRITSQYGTGGVLAFAIGSSKIEAMRIDTSGNLLVGTTSPLKAGTSSFVNGGGGSGTLSLKNTGSARYWYIGPNSNGDYVNFNDAGTGMYMNYGATSWTGTSDERLKENLVPIIDAANKVSTLRAVTGNYISDKEKTSRSFLIAQDVQKVLPEAVTAQNDEIGTLGLSYTDVIPLLVAAIQEQQVMIEELKAKVAALEAA